VGSAINPAAPESYRVTAWAKHLQAPGWERITWDEALGTGRASVTTTSTLGYRSENSPPEPTGPLAAAAAALLPHLCFTRQDQEQLGGHLALLDE
jgi:hypothetical protein